MDLKQTHAQPASFGKRLLAFGIDIVILYVVLAIPLSIVLSSSIGNDYTQISQKIESSPAVMFVAYLAVYGFSFLSLSYFAIMEFAVGQTIGKMLIGLHVISEDNQNISIFRSIGRHLLCFPPFLIIAPADVFSSFFNLNKQRLMEKITKTRVIMEVKLW